MTLAPGKPAPAFTLPDQDGKNVSLKNFKGKWLVLYFYPKDDTPGCTLEGIEFTAQLPALKKLNATVVGVSGDSAESHCDFIKKHRLDVTLLTDSDKAMMTAYGAFKQRLLYGKSFLGIIRSTVLIDPQGMVAHHWPTVKVQGHAEEVVARLKELQA